jgi:uncharacterized LabA/DUF88 family protein
VNPRFAILLDGGFVRKRLYDKLRQQHAMPADVMAECERIRQLPHFASHDLLRIYYYDSPPATKSLTHPGTGEKLALGETDTARRMTAFLDEIELSANVALRKGEVAVRGWKLRTANIKSIVKSKRPLEAEDLAPNIEQKGVDLRIGLDIARLSLGHLVSSIVVVTGDSDLIPAFKFARREGVRVYLDALGAPVKRDLKAHADILL